MKTLADFDASGKCVFVRCDFNVPLDKNLAISDDTRIRSVIPTLDQLHFAGARVILASHLGRPKGSQRPEFSLAPIADHLSGLLKKSVHLAPDCIWIYYEKRIIAEILCAFKDTSTCV